MFGPCQASDDQSDEWYGYIGWGGVIERINTWLGQLPDKLWIDDGGFVFDSEPQADSCDECTGEDCMLCGGSGYIEPFWDAIFVYSRYELAKAIFGKTLISQM